MAPELSFEEKIDYIYKELRWQKRTRFLNFAFKLSLLIILLIWAFNINKWLENDAVLSKISSSIWTIVKPIVNELIKENTASWIDLNDINTETIEIPEIINNPKNKW